MLAFHDSVTERPRYLQSCKHQGVIVWIWAVLSTFGSAIVAPNFTFGRHGAPPTCGGLTGSLPRSRDGYAFSQMAGRMMFCCSIRIVSTGRPGVTVATSLPAGPTMIVSSDLVPAIDGFQA